MLFYGIKTYIGGRVHFTKCQISSCIGYGTQFDPSYILYWHWDWDVGLILLQKITFEGEEEGFSE